MNLEELVYEVFPDLIERDNDEIYASCPFCVEKGETPDTKHRLGINVAQGRWHCFNCNYAGMDNPERLFRELVRIFNLDSSEYRFSWRPPSDRKEVEKKKVSLAPVSLPKEFEPLWERQNERVGKKALKYLLTRGVTKEQIEEHMIGFCAVGERAGRIIIPVYKKDNVIGYVSRAFVKDLEPRYLNSEGLKYLWNASEEKKKRGVLLEGIFDALAAERVLHKVHSMAGLGKDLTDAQLEALLKFKELTIVPDPDKPGMKGVIKRMSQIKETGHEIKLFVVLPSKTSGSVDWGELGESSHGCKKIAKAYEERVPWTKTVATRLKARAAFL